jgi:L-iditol 2-dehydrogenase
MSNKMWTYRLDGPMHYERVEAERPDFDAVAEGNVVIEFLTGGICGSDIARCIDGGTATQPGPIGLSLHEIVGRVVASNSDIAVGERVVGWVGKSLGLKQFSETEAEALAPMHPDMDEVAAIPLQPLACVLHGMTRLPGDLSGLDVAIIGLGPVGLLYAHAVRDKGAASVVGIDLVDRSAVAATYGLDHTEATMSRAWAKLEENQNRFDIVIEVVGHQVGTLQDAISVCAPEGTIIYFGNPDDRFYPIDFGQMMDKNLILQTGRTPQNRRREAMIRAQEYVLGYPELFEPYITHVFGLDELQTAYELAAKPSPGRLKVILDGRL